MTNNEEQKIENSEHSRVIKFFCNNFGKVTTRHSLFWEHVIPFFAIFRIPFTEKRARRKKKIIR